jgi:hypothetical protein
VFSPWPMLGLEPTDRSSSSALWLLPGSAIFFFLVLGKTKESELYMHVVPLFNT